MNRRRCVRTISLSREDDRFEGNANRFREGAEQQGLVQRITDDIVHAARTIDDDNHAVRFAIRQNRHRLEEVLTELVRIELGDIKTTGARCFRTFRKSGSLPQIELTCHILDSGTVLLGELVKILLRCEFRRGIHVEVICYVSVEGDFEFRNLLCGQRP